MRQPSRLHQARRGIRGWGGVGWGGKRMPHKGRPAGAEEEWVGGWVGVGGGGWRGM